MKCVQCENEASAICQFCGRAVCADHISTLRFVSGYTPMLPRFSKTENAVSVADAVHCGVCHPEFSRTV
jgi:hypothetical protein